MWCKTSCKIKDTIKRKKQERQGLKKQKTNRRYKDKGGKNKYGKTKTKFL